ncbi:hypothetical protein QWY31_10775 [Cytophagales bacterium LB-30]|uniref:YbbR-like domain-containing protein n=1 Tax=Shiella aurantiaca TaxID=3058365 RepID=A0ABT8F691_9BACT|nr:hypothetical protein [Shiella aurantiaca]MDN4165988.1 hypothetical protein [Shiella aurantiaca]
MKTIQSFFFQLGSFLLPSSRENLKVVVLSILAATTFWFFTALNKNYTTQINYPISFVYEREGLMEVAENAKEISIDVSGGGWNLLRKTVWFNVPEVVIPIENPLNTHYIRGAALYPEIASQLKEIKLNYVVTDTLFFDIQRIDTLKVALFVPDSAISLETDHRVTSDVMINPDTLLVVGPEKILAQLDGRLAIPLRQTEIDNNFRERINVPKYPFEKVQISPPSVEVFFEVTRYVHKEILVPISYLGAFKDRKAQVSDSTSKVIITLPFKDSKITLVADSFRVIADKRKLNLKDSTLTLTLDKYPAEFTEIRLEKPQVKVSYAE